MSELKFVFVALVAGLLSEKLDQNNFCHLHDTAGITALLSTKSVSLLVEVRLFETFYIQSLKTYAGLLLKDTVSKNNNNNVKMLAITKLGSNLKSKNITFEYN